MKFDTVTIKDIAKALNISKSTVSRALKGASDVSQETRKRVLEYAEKINFQPNPIAASLKEGKSNSIGVVVSEIANTFFSQVIDGIESIAYNKGYRVIITQSHEEYDREIINVQQLCSHSIDGLLISLSSSTSDISHIREWHQKGLPIVLFDKTTDEIEAHKVKVDNYLGAFIATEHLIHQGFTKIAHITALPFLSNTQERISGYKAALEKYNITYKEDFVKYCNHGLKIIAEVEEAFKTLFAFEEKPDAVFTASERTTIACFQLLHQPKYSELGLAGFSNNDLFNHLSPEITIVHQPAFEIGQIATELLIELIERKNYIEEFELKLLEPNLIIGRSSKKQKV